MRINRKGLILGSKPCDNCSKLLSSVGLTNIYYSTDDGDFLDTEGTLIKASRLTRPISMV
jgi:deoxycytidylate deaminase